MRTIRVLAAVLASVLGLISAAIPIPTSRRSATWRWVISISITGANYKSASIMYRRALEKDKLYGPAYYKLGLTYQKQGSLSLAVANFRKAVDQLTKDNPDHWDALARITDIYLQIAHDPQHMKESEQNIQLLLAHDPNSFDAHRMNGDLLFVKAVEARLRAGKDEAIQDLQAAVGQFRIADSIKPGEKIVLMQLARCSMLQGDAAASETLYRRVIDKEKTYVPAYNELYRLYMFQNKKTGTTARNC